MPPADNTPNFDSMTPEEIMRWMESLAKKQGADQGFTTAADMEIPDIDPDSVVIDEPGYVPSEGKDRGKRIESVVPPRKSAATAPATPPAPAVQQPAASAPPAPAVQKPAAAAPPPSAPVAPAQPAAEAEPLSGLSWLESLAADQGGDFPSLDLSSITADLNPAAPAAPAAATSNPIDWLESLSLGQTATDMPDAEPEAAVPAEGLEDPNSWLGSLAMGQTADLPDAEPEAAVPAEGLEDPNSWLGSLAMGQDSALPSAQPAAAASSEEDPMAWMESLAKRQGAKGEELITSGDVDLPAITPDQTDGPGYVDYTFETSTAPVGVQTEFSLPTEAAADPNDIANLQDPAAWLDALASAQGSEGKPKESRPAAATPPPAGSEPKMADDEIQKALAKGEYVPHDQMEAWMNRQLEIGAQRNEPEELTAYDPDAPAVKAEIPDWLLEQVGAMPPEDQEPEPIAPPPFPSSGPALIDTIVEPPAVENIPDWLKEESSSESELENIFAPTEPAAAPPAATVRATAETVSGIEIDPNDPWVEALEMEYAQNKGQPMPAGATPPPAAPAAPPSAPAVAASLKEATLQPEAELPLGEPEPVPDWLQGVVDAPEAEAISEVPDWLMNEIPVEVVSPAATFEPAAAISEIPDWLKSIDMEAADVPGWLTETLSTDTSEEYASTVTATPPTPAVTVAAAQPPAAPVAPAAPAAAIVPARPAMSPAPIQVTNIDVPATLNNARSLASGNDIDGSLQHYELLIRANAELDAVVNDLAKITEKVKTNSAVFRVLGDGLMRKGQLQAALDIYRKALNQL